MNPQLRKALAAGIKQEGWSPRAKKRMLDQVSRVKDGTRLVPSSEDIFFTDDEDSLNDLDSVCLAVDFFWGGAVST